MRSRLLAVSLALGVAACSGGTDATSCIATVTAPCPPIDTTGTPPTPVTTGFVAKTLVDAGVTYSFKVFVPANYNTRTDKVPVIVFLHGSEEKGTDNVKQLSVGLGPLVTALQATFPAIVVFPQAPPVEGSYPTFVRISKAALTQVLTQYSKADPARAYLTGLSYGGIHGYEVAYQNPTTFAAFVPISATICGACLTGDNATTFAQGVQLAVQALKGLPIWQFQGAIDSQVSPVQAQAIRDAFQAAGAQFKYTEYAGLGHDIWDKVYADPAMWTWLYAQHR
jgi:predicted peptidase